MCRFSRCYNITYMIHYNTIYAEHSNTILFISLITSSHCHFSNSAPIYLITTAKKKTCLSRQIRTFVFSSRFIDS